MKFSTMHLDGFGRLHNVDFALTAGLNIFFGPNEAGKSTLQQAIWALLYGFYTGDRKLKQETDLLQRYRPWVGDTHAGHLVYALDSGKTYKIIRDFDESALHTSVSEADTGRDITNTFERGKLGRVSFAYEHFGVSEEVFVNTCFVRQADLHRLAEAAQAISETVVNLSGTGSQDRSVKGALELLDEALREQVGGTRATKKPLPLAQDKLEKLKREKQDILTRRSALENDYVSRGQLLARREQTSLAIAQLQYLQALKSRDRLTSQIEQVDKLLSKKAGLDTQLNQSRAVADFSSGQREPIARQYQEWLSGRNALAKARQEESSTQSEVSELRRQRQESIDQQRPLEAARDIPLEQEELVRDLEQRCRQATTDAQRFNETATTAETSVAELKEVQSLAEQQPAIFQAGPKTLGELRLLWEAAEGRVTIADTELESAKHEWQAQSLLENDFERDRVRFTGFNFDSIASLKALESTAQGAIIKAKAGLPSTALWLMIGLGVISFFAGITLLVMALGTRSLTSAVGGAVAILLGGALGTAAVLQFQQRATLTNRADGFAKQLKSDLDRIGFNNVSELEGAYHTYLEAQPRHDQLTRAMAKLKSEQGNLADINVHGRSLLKLAVDTPLELPDVRTAEAVAQRLAEQWPELKRRERLRDAAAEQFRKSAEALALLEKELRATLEAARFEGIDLARDARRFLDLCHSRRLLDRLEGDRQVLDARLEVHIAKASDLTAAGIALDGTKNQLLRSLRQLGILEDEPEQAFNTFQTLSNQAETHQENQRALDSLTREIQALLGGHSLAQFQQEVAIYARQAQEILATHSNFAGLTTGESRETLQAQIAGKSAEDHKIALDLATLEERISLAWSGVRSLPEVEEEIQSTQATIAALEFHKQALDMARSQLATAADDHNRNFLPRLNQAVGQSLSRITDGRYQDVQIDHANLQVRIKVPDLPTPVTPDVLSRGAQEQIYLLLRLGLTELMSSGRERLPLMLDDPLVNYDAARLLRGLEFLTELAAQTQVLLFTKDETTANWFEAKLANSPMHRLHKL